MSKRAALLVGLLAPCLRAGAQELLTAPDGGQTDWFGLAVSVDGDVAVVGAPLEDEVDLQAGAAYVFRRAQGAWVFEQKLVPSAAGTDQFFGWAVACSGDTALVGAPGRNAPGSPPGAAYLFTFNGNDWVETLVLAGTPASLDDSFGRAVAVDGTRAAVGAFRDDSLGADAGAAFFYEEVGGVWGPVAKVVAPDAFAGDFFGYAIDIDGARALIGAYSDDDMGPNSGAAYVYEDGGAGWAFQAKLVPGSGAPGDLFGRSLNLDGDRALIGSPHHDAVVDGAGAAYVFERVAGSWQETQRLLPVGAVIDEAFGHVVTFAGTLALVGAPRSDPNGPGSGGYYLFRDAGGTWVPSARLGAPDGAPYSYAGIAVGSDASTALVGSHQHAAGGTYGGACYAYDVGTLAQPFADPYCFCDSGAPCGNESATTGCVNSTGSGAVLLAAGSGSVADDDLVLSLNALPANVYGYMLLGASPANNPYADGRLCISLSQTAVRINLGLSNAAGRLELGPGIVALTSGSLGGGSIQPGETWYFQGWYRDTAGPCGGGTNFSNAIAVTFAP